MKIYIQAQLCVIRMTRRIQSAFAVLLRIHYSVSLHLILCGYTFLVGYNLCWPTLVR